MAVSGKAFFFTFVGCREPAINSRRNKKHRWLFWVFTVSCKKGKKILEVGRSVGIFSFPPQLIKTLISVFSLKSDLVYNQFHCVCTDSIYSTRKKTMKMNI